MVIPLIVSIDSLMTYSFLGLGFKKDISAISWENPWKIITGYFMGISMGIW